MTEYTYWVNKKTGETIDDYYDWKALENKDDYEERTAFRESPYEHYRNQVYASGNRWAIENWEATHN